MNKVQVPVSIGELIDKITILEIKRQKITNIDKQTNINLELEELYKIHSTLMLPSDIDTFIQELKKVNLELWDIEEQKRKHEKEKLFDENFVYLARQVYLKNDLRADIKKNINQICGSFITEEKSYE